MSTIMGGRGLLLMSSRSTNLAARVKQCLSSAKNRTCQTLFVCLIKETKGSSMDEAKCPHVPHQPQNINELESISALSHATQVVYAQATDVCPSVDVRLLFKQWKALGPGHSSLSDRLTNHRNFETQDNPSTFCSLHSKSIQWILAESCIPSNDIDRFIKLNVKGQCQSADILNTLAASSTDDGSPITTNGTLPSTDKIFSVVVLGGTFDRLHNGHKVLLTEAAIRCSSEIIVGVTDDTMIRTKRLYELIQPTEDRIEDVKAFLQDIAPEISHRIVPISDRFGPSIIDENIELIVVSGETMRGATKINEIRTEKNFPPLLIHSIPIFEETERESDKEEEKISSSSQRIRLLGKRLKPPLKSPTLPYVVGLTGGIASGKTKLREYLETVRGLPTIDCDKLGHEAYKSGTACFNQIISTFGADIVNTEAEIDRKSLGAKVFGNPEQLKKLTDIVWPEIRRIAESRIAEAAKTGAKLIIVEAAVLVEAEWDSLCHEIWVAFVPREEAIARIQQRDNLPEEKASQRLDSQLSNKERLKKATFAFSSLWEVEFTRKQIEKALNEIQPILDTLQ